MQSHGENVIYFDIKCEHKSRMSRLINVYMCFFFSYVYHLQRPAALLDEKLIFNYYSQLIGRLIGQIDCILENNYSQVYRKRKNLHHHHHRSTLIISIGLVIFHKYLFVPKFLQEQIRLPFFSANDVKEEKLLKLSVTAKTYFFRVIYDL